jgi:hypothetical protein
MELAFVAFLYIAMILAVIVLAIGIPFAVGMLAFDVWQDHRKQATSPKPIVASDTETSIAVKRGIARSYVVLGSAFWSAAAFAEFYSGGHTSEAVMAALLPLGACLVTLVIGWYWERLTAVALMIGAVGVLAWGAVYQFNLQTWIIMVVMLIGPMFTAAVLFWLARRDQEAYELATSLRLQLTPAFAARSMLDA